MPFVEARFPFWCYRFGFRAHQREHCNFGGQKRHSNAERAEGFLSARLSRLMMSPGSGGRVCWDVLCAFLIAAWHAREPLFFAKPQAQRCFWILMAPKWVRRLLFKFLYWTQAPKWRAAVFLVIPLKTNQQSGPPPKRTPNSSAHFFAKAGRAKDKDESAMQWSRHAMQFLFHCSCC